MMKTTSHVSRRTLFALASLAVLLPGCSTPFPWGDASPAPAAGQATVVFSITHDVEFQNGADAIVCMDCDDLRSRVLVRSVQRDTSVPVISDFADRRGHLYILDVVPGTHQFDGWQVRSAGVSIHRKVPAEPLTFDIAAGEVLYLGNIHTHLIEGPWTVGGRSARDGHPEVEDRAVQDVPLAEFKVPELKGRIVTKLLRQGVWLTTPDTDHRIDPVGVPPRLKP